MSPPAPDPRIAAASIARIPGATKSPLRLAARTRLVGEIVLDYLAVRKALRGARLATALACLRSDAGPARSAGQESLREARRLGRAVGRTLALLPGDTRCLTQALVLISLLARRGIDAKLVIGASTAPAFRAHAWVECAGHPLLASGNGQFERLVEL
jgi:Transglutaminase-like superfamily